MSEAKQKRQSSIEAHQTKPPIHQIIRIWGHLHSHEEPMHHTPGIATAAPELVGLILRRTVLAICCLRFSDSKVFLRWSSVTWQVDRRVAKGDAFTSLTPPRNTDADTVLAMTSRPIRIVLALFMLENIMSAISLYYLVLFFYFS